MNSPIRRIGMVLKRHDPHVREYVTEIIPWLQTRGVEVFLDRETAAQYPNSSIVPTSEELPARADIMAVFGGDGTFLYAARLVGGSGVPLLGINLGSLGFLTEVKIEEMHEAFERLLAGNYRIEERVLIDVRVRRNRAEVAHYLALNDAVINK